jgi:hypothetical protein
VLIMRHDVDQHPRSALSMARIERELGVESSWYFRWRTAHPAVVGHLREAGLEVGLHYETLSRHALRSGAAAEPDADALARCRDELRSEIGEFERLFGPIRSVAPHGDTRVPRIRNSALLDGEDLAAYGLEFESNLAMRGRGIAHWLTDRAASEGGWGDGADPAALLATGESPILCVTHPNNWASGPSLWLDRMLRAVTVTSRGIAPATGRPIRTGPDRPPA